MAKGNARFNYSDDMSDGLLDIISKKFNWSSLFSNQRNSNCKYKWIKIIDTSEKYSEYKKSKFKDEIYHTQINWKKEKLFDYLTSKIDAIIKIQRYFKQMLMRKRFPFS